MNKHIRQTEVKLKIALMNLEKSQPVPTDKPMMIITQNLTVDRRPNAYRTALELRAKYRTTKSSYVSDKMAAKYGIH